MLSRTWADPEGPGVPTTSPNLAGRKQASDRATGDRCVLRPAAERDIAVGDGAANAVGGIAFKRYNDKPFGC